MSILDEILDLVDRYPIKSFMFAGERKVKYLDAASIESWARLAFSAIEKFSDLFSYPIGSWPIFWISSKEYGSKIAGRINEEDDVLFEINEHNIYLSIDIYLQPNSVFMARIYRMDVLLDYSENAWCDRFENISYVYYESYENFEFRYPIELSVKLGKDGINNMARMDKLILSACVNIR